jgi:hypothetical protein
MDPPPGIKQSTHHHFGGHSYPKHNSQSQFTELQGKILKFAYKPQIPLRVKTIFCKRSIVGNIAISDFKTVKDRGTLTKPAWFGHKYRHEGQ